MKVKIDKLVFGGQGLGRLENGQVCFVWNALPGEEVEFEVIKKEKTHLEGVTTKILNSSSDRLEPKEKHFLSCSPWQILRPEQENYWKVEMAKETYQKFSDLEIQKLTIENDGKNWGYRNKMEYSFAEGKGEGNIRLSFFERGKKNRECIEPCELASPAINRVAKNILNWINIKKIPIRSLKAVIIRSNLAGQVIAALFIKDKLEFSDYPKLDEDLVGFQLYYSTHKSPASVPTALLYSVGQNYLEEKILETTLKYGVFSFFQINIPVFEMALNDIGGFLDKNKELVDYYSGVGSISLPLRDKCKGAMLVDNNQEAIDLAKENIDLNKLKKWKAECVPAEKMTDLITSDKIIVVDPPRAGLHEKVIGKLLSETPETVIYLSCNLSTQARDIKLLSEKYQIIFSKLYNFFPRTPHVESLIVLKKYET